MSVRKVLGKTELQLWKYANPFGCRRCDEAVWVTYDEILDAADQVIEEARRLAEKVVAPHRTRNKRR
jgi:hypothetical protein